MNVRPILWEHWNNLMVNLLCEGDEEREAEGDTKGSNLEWKMYQFSIVAITNYSKVCSLKQHPFIIHNSIGSEA